MNDIFVSGRIFTLQLPNTTDLIIEGNVTIEGSTGNLNSIELIVEKNVTLSNSQFKFKNFSSIASYGCVNITKTNLTIDLNGINTSKKTLINSTIGCISQNDFSISYINAQSNCVPQTQQQTQQSSLVILVVVTCGSSSIPWYVIVIIAGSILALVIIFLVIVFSIRKIRNKIFTRRKVRDDIKKKTQGPDNTTTTNTNTNMNTNGGTNQ